MIVLDASAALDLLLSTRPGRAVAARIREPTESMHAPHLIDLEVAQVLHRYVSGAQVSVTRATRALADLRLLDLARYGHEPLLQRIWALRGAVTAYDAAYVALAEALSCPLITRDRRLARSTGHRAQVELVG